jgi:hypothetical protein
MQKILLFCVAILLHFTSKAQYFTISGIVTNNKLEPLGLVSVSIKNGIEGAITKEDGTYNLQLEEGRYELVFSMVGHKTQTLTMVVKANYKQNVIMETIEDDVMDAVIIKARLRDRSEEIIRNVVKNKDAIQKAAGAYSCQVYIKATQYDSTVRKNKRLKSPLPETDQQAFAGMSMAEIFLNYDKDVNTQCKEERTGVSKRGNPESLFYLSVTEGDFNLYNNLLKAPALSPVPFLSPVSYAGLAAYKYKMLHIKKVGEYKEFTIRIQPKELSNVTVEGELTISDSNWTILNSRFVLPGYHIPEYDHFEIRQQYEMVGGVTSIIARQQFIYFTKKGKGSRVSGETIASYSNFELNKSFPKKHFGIEVSAAAQDAYEKDSSFWNTIRTEPLSQKEIQFIQYKDSILRVTTSKTYLDSIDHLTNKITWKKILLTGLTFYNREKKRTIQTNSLLDMYQPIQFGGARLYSGVTYNKIFSSEKSLFVATRLSYGFLNKDFNGYINARYLYNPFKRSYWTLNLSKDFQLIFQNDAWINQIKRSNLFLNKNIGIGHETELLNGLRLTTNVDIGFRSSLNHFKTSRKLDNLLDGLYDYTQNTQPPYFDPYKALYTFVGLDYTPRQKYIREPRQKVILGSSWPTFFIGWKKGVKGIINSKIDFDYLEFGMRQQLKLGVTGVSSYKIVSGSFINKNKLELIDYKFMRRGDPLLFMNPNETFQSLDSTFPVFQRFYEAHWVHEFNGAIINKVPLLKKLKLREVAGGGFLFAKERNLRYGELFTGVERAFKWPFNPMIKFKLGIYVVGSVANQFKNPVQFKIGITSWDRSRNRWF